MTKTKINRKPFSLMLSSREKDFLKIQAKDRDLSLNAYLRMKAFEPDKESPIASTKDPIANRAVLEINVKTYQTLQDIKRSLDLLNSQSNQSKGFGFKKVKVDRSLLEETLKQLDIIGNQLAIASAKF